MSSCSLLLSKVPPNSDVEKVYILRFYENKLNNVSVYKLVITLLDKKISLMVNIITTLLHLFKN